MRKSWYILLFLSFLVIMNCASCTTWMKLPEPDRTLIIRLVADTAIKAAGIESATAQNPIEISMTKDQLLGLLYAGAQSEKEIAAIKALSVELQSAQERESDLSPVTKESDNSAAHSLVFNSWSHREILKYKRDHPYWSVKSESGLIHGFGYIPSPNSCSCVWRETSTRTPGVDIHLDCFRMDLNTDPFPTRPGITANANYLDAVKRWHLHAKASDYFGSPALVPLGDEVLVLGYIPAPCDAENWLGNCVDKIVKLCKANAFGTAATHDCQIDLNDMRTVTNYTDWLLSYWSVGACPSGVGAGQIAPSLPPPVPPVVTPPVEPPIITPPTSPPILSPVPSPCPTGQCLDIMGLCSPCGEGGSQGPEKPGTGPVTPPVEPRSPEPPVPVCPPGTACRPAPAKCPDPPPLNCSLCPLTHCDGCDSCCPAVTLPAPVIFNIPTDILSTLQSAPGKVEIPTVKGNKAKRAAALAWKKKLENLLEWAKSVNGKPVI